MKVLFLGWDVGAWNCDRNRESRDALCVLEERNGSPVVAGKPWRGNVRDLLVSHEGNALVDALLQLVAVDARGGHLVSIAIDTPLAWPRRTVDLLSAGTVVNVPSEADRNPYLFREQELALFTNKYRPLSVVRDMIGSQSTKGIHFLQKAQLTRVGTGVWRNQTVVAIETYPACAIRDIGVRRLTSELMSDLLEQENQQRSVAWQNDVRDAITCALVAWLHRRWPGRLKPPGNGADAEEGWIWLPSSAMACA